MASVDDLAERVARLEDERGVLETLHRYGHTIDHGPDDEWLDCFTADGVWDSIPGPELGDKAERITRRGRTELAAFIAGHTHAPQRWHKHLLAEPMIRVHGDEADALSYWVRIDSYEDGIYMRGFGRYRDHLVRGDDGRWRFTSRIIECEAMELRGSSYLLPGEA
jgi:hypothetical protein